ncbi:dihydrodipicolinate synthase family protein [Paraburkholderia sp. Ac-20340]|uniref:dihydrodipicolinate synthase family protein n=1 Tax=Paraburkholderia sp. Ac-20340 TaxID=2703888 RepID=UPI00197D2A1A|nr:dihydrodipicolinate synthase family protein [Paraburkholderia sp. Ac-20340]
MKMSPVTPKDLRGSVIAVPPLARRSDGTCASEENLALLNHMKEGGITSFMYGGNANFYNLGVTEFGQVVDDLSTHLNADEWLIPGVGADFGKAREQLAMLTERAFPTAMVLPLRFPSSAKGVATGLRKLADSFGKPLIAYLKDDGYISENDLTALVKDGAVCAIKYAIVREDPRQDAVLSSLVQSIGTDIIISGIGERPVVDHFRDFGLRSFTSGSGCVAPALASAIRIALMDGNLELAEELREKFIPLENARDNYSPIRVLHSAVEAAGIATTGPLGEFLSVLDDPAQIHETACAAIDLVEFNRYALMGAAPMNKVCRQLA